MHKFNWGLIIALLFCMFFWIGVFVGVANAEVNIVKIAQIESNYNDNAISYAGAKYGRGRHQISEAMLSDYNYYNKTSYLPVDLFNREINTNICLWAVNKRIPKLLKHYGVPVTDDNILRGYNWGCKNVQRWNKGKKKLPSETFKYLRSYKSI